MYTCGIRINAKLVKEGIFRINAKLVKEELRSVGDVFIHMQAGFSQRKFNSILSDILVKFADKPPFVNYPAD